MKNTTLALKQVIRSSRRHGFTLMEMMLVLAIIAVIVGIAVNGIMGAGETADMMKAKTTCMSLDTKVVAFKTFATRFPTQGEGLEALVKKPSGLNKPWVQGTTAENLMDPWGETYQYRNPGKRSGKQYDIFSKGPDRQEGTSDDVGNWE
ncbi:MAG: type II secretion system major pseudopilin GspG [Verrucomicrobiaceae bacterium]|nr:type II secretion system major pseudopilin GspG [Verrucomicrobiaceae bacterium]